MPRQPKSTNPEIETTDTEAPKRTRTYMHTARIVKACASNGYCRFIVTHNGKVTAMFETGETMDEFKLISNEFGMYDGFSKYYRSNLDEFTTVLITKSEDSEVAAAQADRFAAESFLRSYLDRLSVKSRLDESAAKREAEYVEANS